MKFSLGTVVATPGAIAFMEEHKVNATMLLSRHQTGDWGDVDEHDRAMNDAAVTQGNRVLSSYTIGFYKLWIITESDRSATTILLPEEY